MVMLAEDRATDAPPPITWTVIPVPVQIGVSSNTSDVLMDALVAHRRVCEAADAFRDKRDEVVTFHELALPLVLGREVEWASRDPGKDGSSTTVYTFASGHPGRITKPYGRGMWCPTSIHKQAEALFGGIQLWAQRYQHNGGLPQETASEDEAAPGSARSPVPTGGTTLRSAAVVPSSGQSAAPIRVNGRDNLR